MLSAYQIRVLSVTPIMEVQEMNMKIEHKQILITGGCSFIGSHLAEYILEHYNSHVTIVDNLSSGTLENIKPLLEKGRVEFVHADLLDVNAARRAMAGINIVFHLAAVHGGRGFIDLNQAQCAQNFALDNNVIREAYNAGVEKIVFASSGCVYPVDMQADKDKEIFLEEDTVTPPYNADGLYGWAKLMAELTLKNYFEEYGLKSVACRLFTVYGERCLESHAIMAMISRAFLKLNPFEIWGNGEQIRNWTYVKDIVKGMVLAAEKIDDATAINLGTEERIKVIDAVQEILRYTHHKAEIRFKLDMPTGPINRVASNRLACDKIGWVPEYSFVKGLHNTIDWYFETKASSRDYLQEHLPELLLKRGNKHP